MWLVVGFFSIICSVVNGLHFNGGTITWTPVDPFDNSTSVLITITQSYSWSYPNINCLPNVPTSTSGWAGQNANLTCVFNCGSDGGYSAHPIDILTNCTSSSLSLGMLTSQRSVNVTLMAGAHFSIAYRGAAWRALNYPAVGGLDWSILCAIDIRRRPDGLINTPPVTNIVSPQYVIVNQTTQIKIPVSDVNQGDDVRCRWSAFTQGNRRRRAHKSVHADLHRSPHDIYKSVGQNEEEYIRSRVKRAQTGVTSPPGTTVTATTTTTTRTTRTTMTTTSESSTSELPGTIRTTSLFPNRQSLDECAGICYPTSTPNDTTLSNCTLTFTGLVPGAWYAVAIQVEDFINSTSNEPMSSVPIQFLVYVLPTPFCPFPPVFTPPSNCLDVQTNVPVTFNLYVNNSCDPTDATIADVVVTQSIPGMTVGPLTSSSAGSLASVTLSWTPQSNQIGAQELCATAFTSERVQSEEYCVTFNVQMAPACTTTTTTTTSTTTETTSTTESTTTSATTTTATTTTITTATNKPAGDKFSWLLFSSLLLLALLSICAACCCLHYWLWGAGARRRRRKRAAKREGRYMQYSPFGGESNNRLPFASNRGNSLHPEPTLPYSHLDSSYSLDTFRRSTDESDSQTPCVTVPQNEKGPHVKRICHWEKPVENERKGERQSDGHTSATVINVKKAVRRSTLVKDRPVDMRKSDGVDQQVRRSDTGCVNVTKVNARASRVTAASINRPSLVHPKTVTVTKIPRSSLQA